MASTKTKSLKNTSNENYIEYTNLLKYGPYKKFLSEIVINAVKNPKYAEEYKNNIEEYVKQCIKNGFITQENYKDVIERLNKIKILEDTAQGVYGEWKSNEGKLEINPMLDKARRKLYLFHELTHATIDIDNDRINEIGKVSKPYGKVDDFEKRNFLNGFKVINEGVAQEVAETCFYSSINKERPKEKKEQDSIFQRNLSYNTNFDYYGLYQPLITEFGRTLKDADLSKDNAETIRKKLCKRAFNKNFPENLIIEYVKNGKEQDFYNIFGKMSVIFLKKYYSFIQPPNTTDPDYSDYVVLQTNYNPKVCAKVYQEAMQKMEEVAQNRKKQEKNNQLKHQKTKQKRKQEKHKVKENIKPITINELIQAYELTENKNHHERRIMMEEYNMEQILKSIKNKNVDSGIIAKLTKGSENSQIATMVRLLKAADNLTIKGTKNYLQEFTQIPKVKKILDKMLTSRTVQELNKEAKENKQKGKIINYEKTPAEVDKNNAEKYLEKQEDIKKELETRNSQINNIDKIVIDMNAKKIEDVPKERIEKAALIKVLLRQQGKRPGKFQFDKNTGCSFEIYNNSNEKVQNKQEEKER